MKRPCLPIILLLFLFALPAEAKVKLPAVFTDGMVLQQQSKVPVWGWTKAGSTVSVTPSWNERAYSTVTEATGKWKVKINTPSAGGPYEIIIRDGESVKITDVLVGEVWVCSGQSNMEMPMKGFRTQPVSGATMAILKSGNSEIRLLTVPRSVKTEAQQDFTGHWQEAAPATVADFSATAWYFGRLLNEILDVPIGLIDISYGGSRVAPWMTPKSLRLFAGVKIPEKGDPVHATTSPAVLYNGMLSPVIGYGIKGCIWYQGESNHTEPDTYDERFAAMVKGWRSAWGMGEFPFYYAQIAPFDYTRLKHIKVHVNSAYLREAQLKAMEEIPNSGMAILMDTGEKNYIHPANKEAAGNRLAYWALGKTYGIKGFEYASPVLESMTIKEDTAILTFKNAPNGLTSFGKELTCFEIAGKDKRFYPAQAKIIRNSSRVSVSSPKVGEPLAVRYAFKDFIIGDLFSTGGLPVSSFRTDNWK